MEISLEDARELVKFARKNIEYYLQTGRRLPIPEKLKKKFGKNQGAFVTLNLIKGDKRELRGCIGITQPIYPLIDVISNVSLSAAFDDPRFPPVKDLKNIAIEVSILTEPKLIEVKDPSEYLEKIKIGRDGLLIEKGKHRGLLLPQVPVTRGRNWDVKTFLEHLCLKALLPKDAWKDKDTKIYAFRAIIFEELTPGGEVAKKEI